MKLYSANTSTYVVSRVGQGEVHTLDQLMHTCMSALYTFNCYYIIHKMAGLLQIGWGESQHRLSPSLKLIWPRPFLPLTSAVSAGARPALNNKASAQIIYCLCAFESYQHLPYVWISFRFHRFNSQSSETIAGCYILACPHSNMNMHRTHAVWLGQVQDSGVVPKPLRWCLGSSIPPVSATERHLPQPDAATATTLHCRDAPGDESHQKVPSDRIILNVLHELFAISRWAFRCLL